MLMIDMYMEQPRYSTKKKKPSEEATQAEKLLPGENGGEVRERLREEELKTDQ